MKMNEIIIRTAALSDAEAIASLMQEVYERLEDKSIYICDDLNYIRDQLGREGMAAVACNRDGRIVGSFVLRFPGASEDNLGRDIDLPEDELCRVVHMDTAVVLPEYRGRGIQSLMLSYAERLIDIRRYNIFMATVSPDNPASCRTFEKNGYDNILTKEKYGGLIRRIYIKRINET